MDEYSSTEISKSATDYSINSDDANYVTYEMTSSPSSDTTSKLSIASSNDEALVFFYNRSDEKEIINELAPIYAFVTAYGIQSKLHYMGLVGNLLCILVFTRKQMTRRKSIFYLIFLALSDFMYNLVNQMPIMLMDLRIVNFHIFKSSDFSCFFYDYAQVIFHVYSVLITLFVTVDRFNHIYNPLKFNQKLIARKTKVVVGLGLFLASAVFALPHGYLFVYNEQEKTCDGRNLFKMKIGNSSISYYQAYFTFTEPIIMWFIPGLVIVCMNIYVIYKIFQSKRLPTMADAKNMPVTTSFKNVTFTNGGSNVTPPLQPQSQQPIPQQQQQQREVKTQSPKLQFYYKNEGSGGSGTGGAVVDRESVRLYYERAATAAAAVAATARSSSASSSRQHQQQQYQEQQQQQREATVNIYLNKVKFYFLCFIRTQSSDSIAVKSNGLDDFYMRADACRSRNNTDDYDMVNFARRHGGGLVAIAGIQPPSPCDELLMRPNMKKCTIDEYILNKHFNRKKIFISQRGPHSTTRKNKCKKLLNRDGSLQSTMTTAVPSTLNRVNTLKYRILNLKNTKLSVNQISHYITIIILGFYFIVTTIPYGIVLSLQNHFTIDLNYFLRDKSAYMSDELWRAYGQMKDLTAVIKTLFITNHCFNIFLYLLFNRLFRLTIWQIVLNIKKLFPFSLWFKSSA